MTIDRRYGVAEGQAVKSPCRAATTANITLSGEQTIDGVSVVDGDRVLVKNQTAGSENGIYVASTGNWVRGKDFDGALDAVTGTRVLVTSGTVAAGLDYYISTTGTITIGTTSIQFITTVTGSQGEDAGFKYTFNSATSGDPATGQFLFNNATFTSATQINISETDGDASGLASLLATLDDSTSTNKCLVVFRKENGSAAFIGYLTGTLTDNGTYDTFSFTPVVKVGSIANGDLCRLTAFRVGDAGTASVPITPQGRLTLTSGTPLPTADVTGAGTAYYAPMIGRYVPIFDGSTFVNVDILAELSNVAANSAVGKAGPAAAAVSSAYGFVIWLDGVTPRLTRTPAWASDTNPGTGAGTAEMEQVQGIWVNKVAITNGPAAQRGTIVGGARTNGAAQFVDSVLFRWLSNIYNAVPRKMLYRDIGGGHNYSSATVRQWNASAAAQVDFFQVLDGNLLTGRAACNTSNTGIGDYSLIDMGLDSTTVGSSELKVGPSMAVANLAFNNTAFYSGYPGRGRHYLSLLQSVGAASGTTTWIASPTIPSGMFAEILN